MHSSRPPRLANFDYRGLHRYFLTFETDFRRPVFTNGDAVALVLWQFRRANAECGFANLAYCLMPDHVHLLVAAERDDAALKPYVRRAKQYAGYYYAQTFKERLWRRDCYEHVLRSDEGTAAVVRYIMENPVKAGLARTFQEYPYCGSDVYGQAQLEEFFFDPERWEPG